MEVSASASRTEENAELQQEVKCFSEEMALLQELCPGVETVGGLLGFECQEGLRRLREASEQLQADVETLVGRNGEELAYNEDYLEEVEDDSRTPDLSDLIFLGEQHEREWRSCEDSRLSPYSTISPLVALYSKDESLRQHPLLPTAPSLTASVLRAALKRHGLLSSPTAEVTNAQEDRLDRLAAQVEAVDQPPKVLQFGTEKKTSNGSPESPSSLSDFSPRTLLRTPDLRFSFSQDSRLGFGVRPGGLSETKTGHGWQLGQLIEAQALEESGVRHQRDTGEPANGFMDEDAATCHDTAVRYFTHFLAGEQQLLQASLLREKEAREKLAMLEAEHAVVLNEMKRLKEERLAQSQQEALVAGTTVEAEAAAETLSDMGLSPEDVSEEELRAVFVEERRQRKEAETSVVELSGQLASMSAMVQELSKQLERIESAHIEHAQAGAIGAAAEGDLPEAIRREGASAKLVDRERASEAQGQAGQKDTEGARAPSSLGDGGGGEGSRDGSKQAAQQQEGRKALAEKESLGADSGCTCLDDSHSSLEARLEHVRTQLAASEKAKSAAEEQVAQLEPKVQQLEGELAKQGRAVVSTTRGQTMWMVVHLVVLLASLAWVLDGVLDPGSYGGLPPT